MLYCCFPSLGKIDLCIERNYFTPLQSQKAVTAYFLMCSSKQLLPFDFVGQHTNDVLFLSQLQNIELIKDLPRMLAGIEGGSRGSIDTGFSPSVFNQYRMDRTL